MGGVGIGYGRPIRWTNATPGAVVGKPLANRSGEGSEPVELRERGKG